MGCANEKLSVESMTEGKKIFKLGEPVKKKDRKSLSASAAGITDNNPEIQKDPVAVGGGEPVAAITAEAGQNKEILNNYEVLLLRKSFKKISKQLDTTGIKMFTKLFMKNPTYLAMFPKVSIPRHQISNIEAYESDMALGTHSEVVMNTVDEVINCLTEYDKCHTILFDLGLHHSTIRGFKSHYIYSVEEPLLDAIKEVIGSTYSEELGVIYKKVVIFIMDTIYKGCALGEKQKEERLNRQLSIS